MQQQSLLQSAGQRDAAIGGQGLAESGVEGAAMTEERVRQQMHPMKRAKTMKVEVTSQKAYR